MGKENYAEKAERATADLRTVVQEAHMAIKDLRELLKEAREVEVYWRAHVEDVFRRAVQEQMEAYLARMKELNEDSVQRVYQKFDRITAILMGQEPEGEQEDLISIARNIRANLKKPQEIPLALRKEQQ